MLLIVDGNSMLNIQYYGGLNVAEEERVKASDAIFNLIGKLRSKFPQIDHVAVVLDKSRETTFRRQIYPEYKTTRESRPAELKQEIAEFILKCDQKGIITLQHPYYEADDFAGSLVKHFMGKDNVVLLTADQDYLQLVNSHCFVWLYKKDKKKVDELVTKYGSQNKVTDKIYTFTKRVIQGEYGLKYPCQITDLKGFCGDVSDNIKGIKNFGASNASILLQNYDSIEDVCFHMETETENDLRIKWKSLGIKPRIYKLLQENADQALFAKKLATIYKDIPLNIPYECFAI